MGYKHYSGSQVNEIRACIKVGKSEGKSLAQIAAQLTGEGLLRPDGGSWTASQVSGFLNRYPVRMAAKKSTGAVVKATKKRSTKDVQLNMAKSILNSGMASDVQLRLLTALLSGK